MSSVQALIRQEVCRVLDSSDETELESDFCDIIVEIAQTRIPETTDNLSCNLSVFFQEIAPRICLLKRIECSFRAIERVKLLAFLNISNPVTPFETLEQLFILSNTYDLNPLTSFISRMSDEDLKQVISRLSEKINRNDEEDDHKFIAICRAVAKKIKFPLLCFFEEEIINPLIKNERYFLHFYLTYPFEFFDFLENFLSLDVFLGSILEVLKKYSIEHFLREYPQKEHLLITLIKANKGRLVDLSVELQKSNCEKTKKLGQLIALFFTDCTLLEKTSFLYEIKLILPNLSLVIIDTCFHKLHTPLRGSSYSFSSFQKETPSNLVHLTHFTRDHVYIFQNILIGSTCIDDSPSLMGYDILSEKLLWEFKLREQILSLDRSKFQMIPTLNHGIFIYNRGDEAFFILNPKNGNLKKIILTKEVLCAPYGPPLIQVTPEGFIYFIREEEGRKILVGSQILESNLITHFIKEVSLLDWSSLSLLGEFPYFSGNGKVFDRKGVSYDVPKGKNILKNNELYTLSGNCLTRRSLLEEGSFILKEEECLFQTDLDGLFLKLHSVCDSRTIICSDSSNIFFIDMDKKKIVSKESKFSRLLYIDSKTGRVWCKRIESLHSPDLLFEETCSSTVFVSKMIDRWPILYLDKDGRSHVLNCK